MSVNSAIASKNNNEKITVNGIEYAGTLYDTWAEALAATGVDAYVADGLTLERQNTGAKEVVLNNVTISGQEATAGGAIATGTGKVTISGGTYSNNVSTEASSNTGGGAVYRSGSTLEVTTSVVDGKVVGTLFDGNTAIRSGGAIAARAGATVSVTGATFINNYTDGNGGAVLNVKSTVTITDSLFYNNSNSGGTAGSVHNDSSGTTILDGCTFATAKDEINNKSGVVTFKNTTLLNADINGAGTYEVAENGAFIFDNDTAIALKNLDFKGGNALTFKGSQYVKFADGQSLANVTSVSVDGSGYLLSGTYSIATNAGDLIDVDKIQFTAGTAEFITGQQLSYANGTLSITVESSAVAAAIYGKNNAVKVGDTYYAGTVYDSWADALAAANATTFVADSVTLERQDLAAGKTVVLNNVTISGQEAAAGGAIVAAEGLVIAGGTFSGNNATEGGQNGGGAVYITTQNITITTTVVDGETRGALFDGNNTGSSGGGVGIRGGGSAVITGATFSNNTAQHGAGVANIKGGGSITVTNSLFDGNDEAAYNAGGGTMTIDGCTFAKYTDTIVNSATLTFKNENILNAKLTGAATVANGASFVFDNDMALDFSGAAFTFDGNNAITFKGSKTVTFAATDSLANVAITVDGADYTAAGSYVIAADAAGITAGNLTFNPAATLAPYLSQNLSYADNTLTLNVVSSAVSAALYTSSGKDAIKLGDTWYSGTACDSWSEALAVTGVSKYIADGVGLGQQTAAMLTDKDVIFNNVTIKDQTTTTGGGAINDGNRIITIAGGTFANNSAVGGSNNAYGGGALKLDTGFVITTTLVDGKVTGALFSGNNSDKTGGAIQVNANDLSVDGATFYQNFTSSAHGGAIGDRSGSATDITVSNTTFDRNKTAGSGGAIYSFKNASLSVTDSVFTGNTAGNNGGAISIEKGAVISGSKFYNNTVGTESAGGAIYVASSATDGVIIRDSLFSGNTAARGTVSALANVEITGSEFSGNTAHISGAALNVVNVVEVSGSEFDKNIASANGGAVIIAKGDGYQATFADTVFSGNTAVTEKGGAIYNQSTLIITTAVVNGETKGVLFSGNTSGISGAAIMQEDAAAAQTIIDGATFKNNYAVANGTICITKGSATISNTVFEGNIANNGGAIYCDAAVTVTDSQFLTATDTIYVQTSGTLTFGGSITLNSALGGRGTYVISKDTVFTNAVDLSAVNISVDGSLYQDKAVTIATGVSAIGKYTTGIENLFLTVENGSLILREANVTADVTTFAGTGSNLMTAGVVGTLFADKSGADNIATTIQGGKVESNLVGGAYVPAGETTAVDKVELLIGGTAELADGSRAYAGGYLYGNAGDTEAAAEAQLTVDLVNINLTGGTVGGNLYGGAHARQNGNASVTEVNITVTAGNHSRIYAGGWAEKGAVSSVGTANVTISGGTVDYLYGGGANAYGKTYVTTTNITVSDAAVVNTIFMGGRYGYSYVNTVELTFNGEAKTLKRLSGVSSAGMDYSEATVVELETNVTADLIDYVDNFTINEGFKLTANHGFFLGSRDNETGLTVENSFTTFNFVTDGDFKDAWEAVAGIEDFTNAQFSVNGAGLTTWDGKAALAIGGYSLTYDATDKTIKLAQITA
ncbi:MAG: hypothetical protein E7041_06950 [Lentisphaerae bacterium]|nr:hypothetical protein [Lentisphaerota bacterium]